MSEETRPETMSGDKPFVGEYDGKGGSFLDALTKRWLSTAAVVSIGLIAGGYLLGDGLLRAKEADRSVTVRGLAERDVTADLATWTISYASSSTDLAGAQAKVRRDTENIRAFFKDLGFPEDALQPTGANVSSYTENGVTKYTVRQRLALRSDDIALAQKAVSRQFDLVSTGVFLEEGSGMSYSFTKLNEIKPEMVAEATRDARAAAEQFAEDSGTEVGAIREATQGYFTIEARDGEAGGWGVADSPFKKVRVVTTINFSIG
ncbi:SIMPL domain-containing protein [Erythrobacter litoralis]|uniref:Putative periplasmic protein n=1 Tax=Erythrobacter litoralis (strain HTCC2594) TaxID=314225 RepID=Q2NDA3_ERYLH|nr:SIMPL domain-containing protein [Erythrobacter litoralis]ABC62338.1 putative periplasmic protein [Erythrobacter litoralis HTCC2594]